MGTRVTSCGKLSQWQSRSPSCVLPHKPHSVISTADGDRAPRTTGRARGLAQRQQMRRCSRRQSVVLQARQHGRTVSQHVASSQGLLTLQEVQEIALSRGLEITVKSLGPFYRIVCRDAAECSSSRSRTPPSSAERAAEEAAAGVGGRGRVLAVTSGFIVPPPLGLMHCDTLQIFTKGQRGEEGSRTRGGMLGLGLLMGAATFAFGRSCGCRKAEILAINDDDSWHARLVRYYGRFGFQPVRVVQGDSLADLPHMLVWGGAGTRMDADVEAMLARWTRAVRRNSAAAGTAGREGEALGMQGVAEAAAKQTAA